MGRLTEKLYNITYDELVEKGTKVSKQEFLNIIDNYFRGLKQFTIDKETIKIDRFGKFVYDPDAKDKRAKFNKKAQEEVDKVMKEKGIVSKKDIAESLHRASIFANIKKL